MVEKKDENKTMVSFKYEGQRCFLYAMLFMLFYGIVSAETPIEDPAELIEKLALTKGPASNSDGWTYNKDEVNATYIIADKLRRQGKKSKALLLKHLDDNRRSVPYQAVASRNQTVGHTCYHILRQQIFALPKDYYYEGYWRDGADGEGYRTPYFYETNGLKPSLFDRSTIRKWLKDREKKTFQEIQIEALTWILNKEKSIGFPTESDKKRYLYPLERQLKKIKDSK